MLLLNWSSNCSLNIGWFNNDPEQPHTVTSGLPGPSDSGTSLILALCQPRQIHSFNIRLTETGDFVYHCEIHPWRVAIVSVNAVTDRGTNFEFL